MLITTKSGRADRRHHPRFSLDDAHRSALSQRAAAARVRPGHRRRRRHVHQARLLPNEYDVGPEARCRHADVGPLDRPVRERVTYDNTLTRLRRQRSHDVLSLGRREQPERYRRRQQRSVRPVLGPAQGVADAARPDSALDGNVAYVDDRGKFVQKGSNTSGVSLGSWRTPPEFNNFEYLDPASGLHRSFRFPEPSTGSINTSRGYDNPLFAIKNQDNTPAGRARVRQHRPQLRSEGVGQRPPNGWRGLRER